MKMSSASPCGYHRSVAVRVGTVSWRMPRVQLKSSMRQDFLFVPAEPHSERHWKVLALSEPSLHCQDGEFCSVPERLIAGRPLVIGIVRRLFPHERKLVHRGKVTL